MSTTVTATKIQDIGGNPISNATATFIPRQAFKMGGGGQVAEARPVSVAVSNGGFTVSLFDTSIGFPANVGYDLVVVDNLTGNEVMRRYNLQPSGATWNFDTDYTPPGGPNAVTVVGINYRGAWQPNTLYALRDAFTVNGTTYFVAGTFTSGSSFTVTGNLGIIAPKGDQGIQGIQGVQGIQGIQGPIGVNFRGAWAANTAYAASDAFYNNGTTYYVTSAFTSGSTFSVLANFTTLAAASSFPSTVPIAVTFQQNVAVPSITASGNVSGPAVSAGTSLAVGSGSVDTDIPTFPELNAYGLLSAVVDAGGRIISGILPDGTFWFPGGINVPTITGLQSLSIPTFSATTLTGTSISAGGGSTDTAISSDPIENPLGLIHAVVDADKRVVMGILPNGTALFPAGISGQSLTSTATDSEGFTYYTQQAGGYYQIFRKDDVGNVLQLTSGSYNNVLPSIAGNGSLVAFMTDRGGSMVPYQMDRGGMEQKPLGTDMSTLYNLNGIATTGQSLSVGYNAVAITLTQPLDNVTLNGGPRSGSAGGTAVLSTNLTSIVSLNEVQGSATGFAQDTGFGETISSTVANTLASMALNSGIRFRMAALVNGQSGQPYTGIKQGTVPFNNGVVQVTALHGLAATAGLTHATRAMCLVHGEDDDSSANTNYYANIKQLRIDTVAAHKAAIGQDFDFPLFLCQVSSWTSYKPSATGVAAYQQLRAMTESIGQIYLVAPKYFLTYKDSAHINEASQQWLGEYYARAMHTVLIKRKMWRPIYPRKIARIGNKIYIRFWVPEGNSLVLDTTQVTQPTANPNGKMGFEYTDDTTPPAISSVVLTPGTTDCVTITLAATPTGANNRIRYAYTGTPGNTPGPTTGARGNLRDNDPTASTTGKPNMYNWCCHFDYAC